MCVCVYVCVKTGRPFASHCNRTNFYIDCYAFVNDSQDQAWKGGTRRVVNQLMLESALSHCSTGRTAPPPLLVLLVRLGVGVDCGGSPPSPRVLTFKS